MSVLIENASRLEIMELLANVGYDSRRGDNGLVVEGFDHWANSEYGRPGATTIPCQFDAAAGDGGELVIDEYDNWANPRNVALNPSSVPCQFDVA